MGPAVAVARRGEERSEVLGQLGAGHLGGLASHRGCWQIVITPCGAKVDTNSDVNPGCATRGGRPTTMHDGRKVHVGTLGRWDEPFHKAVRTAGNNRWQVSHWGRSVRRP